MEPLVNKLMKDGMIKSEEVRQALLKVDRAEFVLNQGDAYQDRPLSIQCNVTISAPHMHGFALEQMKNQLIKAKRVLDVGSGSGYLCAAMKVMMQADDGVVVGVEHAQELVKSSISNLQKSYGKYLEKQQIMIVEADGRQGYSKMAPYQVIHVGAGAEKIPEQLLEQLDRGGRMVIPVGYGVQNFQIVDKDMDGKIHIQNVLSVRYVPLTDLKDQMHGS